MKYLIASLLLVTSLLPAKAAVLANSIIYSSDTTGTNARASSITITDKTNLLSGTITVTNSFIGGSGTDRSILATSPMGNFGILAGTTAAPDTNAASLFKVVRTVNLQTNQYFGDGGEKGAAILGTAWGVETNQIQVTGVGGLAKTLSTNFSGLQGNDACGIYGIGMVASNATGRGLGSFFGGYKMTDTARGEMAAQFYSYNGGTTNSPYSATSAPDSAGLWITAAGPTPSSVGQVFANASGQQFDYGIQFNGQVLNSLTGGVKYAGIIDDSVAERFLLIRGARTNGAISVAANAGFVSIGGTNQQLASTLLEVQGPAATANPLVLIGSTVNGNSYATYVRNSQGSLVLAVSGSAGGFLTGTVQGDAVISPSATKSLNLGATTKVITVKGDNTLGFFAATPVAQQANTVSTRAALVNYGLLASGVTIDPTPAVAGTIASASTIAPTARITFISGTAAIDTITAPTGVASTGGQITLIPTGLFTTTTSGNIALATTAVVSKALIMTYDATATKWYPSY